MKKKLCGLLLTMAAAACLCTTAQAAGNVVASGVEEGGLSWTLDAGGVLTVSGQGKMTDYYTVHNSYSGTTIESVMPGWESYADRVKEVVVQAGVTSVGRIAFADMDNLTKVTLADTVTIIDEYAFYNDSYLTNIDLGDGVITIQSNAFAYSGLTSLYLPATLHTIEAGGLLGLYDLESIQVDAGNNTYSATGGVLYSKDGTKLVQYPLGNQATQFTVASGVTEIGEGACAYAKFTQVDLPSSLKTIGKNAFQYCRKLTSVTIPDGVTSLGKNAFGGCDSLTSATVPNSLTTLDNVFPSQTKIEVDQGSGWLSLEDGTLVQGASVTTQAEEVYSYAFQVLELVNQERASAGLSALTMDESLLDTAMLRAQETVLHWDHIRPSGMKCFTANKLMTGENIAAGQRSPEAVMNAWMNSDGHRANILGKNYNTIGIGCIKVDGAYYWVQCFGKTLSKEATASSYTDKTATRTFVVSQDTSYYAPSFALSATSLSVGGSATATVSWSGHQEPFEGITMTSSDSGVCRVEGSQVVGVSAGTAQITMYYNDYPQGGATFTVTVSAGSGSSSDSKSGSKSGGSTVSFTDVAADIWYADAVNWAVANGITNGTGNNTFSPNATCNRAQIVTFLWRAAGEPEPTGSNPFADVSSGQYYYKAVLWAYEKGITTGTTATTFSPNANCNRAQIVTFLWRWEGEQTASSASTFSDVAAGWYQQAVSWAVAEGITNGTGNGTFSPNKTCTRAEAVTFLYRDET